MPSFLRLTCLSAICAATLAGQGLAQSYSAGPIAFDVADDATNASPILIAAYQPPADSLPRFASANAGRGAVATLAGLPTPSIILGKVEPGQEAAFGITALLPDTVAQLAFDFDDLEARNRMRSEDPEMLVKLIEQGHIDPPAEQLNVALQTELQRMNCYRSGIDGAWGPGSRRSVGSYFGKREDGTTWPDQEPSTDLFRTIILHPDVTCDTPVAAAPTRQRSTSSTTTRRATTTTTRQTTTTRRATAPAPAPKPAAKPKIKAGGGIGVFR